MAAMEAKKSKEKDVKPSSAGAGRGRGAPTKEVSRAPGGGGHKGAIHYLYSLVSMQIIFLAKMLTN